MLRFEDVYKTYRRGNQPVEALRGVNLTIDRPGFFAIMGPSGSGKTTLLHLAAGLDVCDRGSVVVGGDDISTMNEGALTQFRRSKVGIIFQRFNLIATLTAKQNVALPGIVAGKKKQWANQRADALLAELGISERADHRPDALSGGEQQRVAIARALLFEPPLILADEPTGALDSASSEVLWGILRDVADKHGTTVVMVTHEPAAAAHCQTVFILGDGVCRGQFEVDGINAGDLATRYQQLSR